MTITESERRSSGTPATGHETSKRRASLVRGATGAVGLARRSATSVIERTPRTVHAARAGAHEATIALQRLPDSTLRWLAASSVGLAAGLQVAGAPRLVRLAGVGSALFMGAAIASRPAEPVVTVEADR